MSRREFSEPIAFRGFGRLACSGLLHSLLLATAFGQTNASLLPPATDRRIDFAMDVAPLLQQRCQSCHGDALASSGLRLDSREAALRGGYSGVVIQPGNSRESKLIQLVAGLNELVMPMSGDRLTPDQIGVLRAWIDQGADWPETNAAGANAKAGAENLRHNSENPKSEPPQAHSSHWAFNPPHRPQLPDVANSDWVRNPIDRFVLARLEAEGIQPSPEAEKTTLIRRLSLDLIGLPPTPAEVEQFVSDDNPKAYEKAVDRLLRSPHYGEKWARHWLDLARYGDSDGFETDAPRPHAWRYRHWVINALNRNMPFDQFTIEQLAGDLLPNATLEQRVATGFNRNTLTNREGGMDLEMLRVEQIIDRTNTLGTVWLGLTTGCAVCHDHKFDPLTQKDYYQLFAFFNRSVEENLEAPLAGEMGPFLAGKPEYDRKRRELLAEYQLSKFEPEWEQRTLEAETNPDIGDQWILAWETVGYDFDGGQDILRTPRSQRTLTQQDQLTDHMLKWYGIVASEEREKELKIKELREKLQKLAEEYPALSEAQAMAENPSPPPSHLLVRGDFHQPGIEVQPATPAFLPPLPDGAEPNRLSLARWLVSEENPLTARVAVNRMWQEFFGRGLAETSENFGTQGDPPSHPKLLDFLAARFTETGWNVKQMHKLIVESATYRQSSMLTRPKLETRDPSNRLLARQTRLRLSAELIRDATLAASGLLNPEIGGKSVSPPQPKSVNELIYADQWKESTGRDVYRRGLYVFLKRTMPYPQLATFDAPDSLTSCSRRERSTTPLQALNLLNDPLFVEAAQALSARVLREVQGTDEEQVDYAFRLCLSRAPTADEKDRLVDYYRRRKTKVDRDPEALAALFPAEGVTGIDRTQAAALAAVGSVLLNLDEFITRE